MVWLRFDWIWKDVEIQSQGVLMQLNESLSVIIRLKKKTCLIRSGFAATAGQIFNVTQFNIIKKTNPRMEQRHNAQGGAFLISYECQGKDWGCDLLLKLLILLQYKDTQAQSRLFSGTRLRWNYCSVAIVTLKSNERWIQRNKVSVLWTQSPNSPQSKLVRDNTDPFWPKNLWQPLKQNTVSLCLPIQRRMAACQLVFGTIISFVFIPSHLANVFTLSSTILTFVTNILCYHCVAYLCISLILCIIPCVYVWPGTCPHRILFFTKTNPETNYIKHSWITRLQPQVPRPWCELLT